MYYIHDGENREQDIVRSMLLNRKIVCATNDTLYLENGMKLHICGNYGCGGCEAGNYDITELNECDNAITNVEFVVDYPGKYESEKSYKIFVYAENKKIKALQVDGDDGNGYYGTGYSITVDIGGV